MIVMICVDDHNGMMFNHRRQSRDSAVQERVLRCSENSRLWMNEYSSKLFPDLNRTGCPSIRHFLTGREAESTALLRTRTFGHMKMSLNRSFCFNGTAVIRRISIFRRISCLMDGP